MFFLKHLLKKIIGIHFPQEYLCIGKESFLQPFKIKLLDPDKNIISDVSDKTILLGYKPVLIGISFDKLSTAQSDPKEYLLSFAHNGKEIACLQLKKLSVKLFGETEFLLLQCVSGKHRLISLWQQWTTDFAERFRKKPEGNIFLKENLYEQVRIAYSVPRIISLVTVSDGMNYNLFPTDLHGSINEDFYVDSLRIDNKAGKQVEKLKRMVITAMDSISFRQTYLLGKNHSKDLRSPENFPLSEMRSAKFNWRLPEHFISYTELELTDTTDVGIHRLFFFKIIHRENTVNEFKTLAHVHRYAAEWRRKKNISTEYLIR